MAILRKGGVLGICVHHSVYQAAKNLTELKAHAVKYNTWHKSKSWAEKTKTSGSYPYISYHYLIALDGSILKVTNEKYVKYHAGDNFRGKGSFNLHGIAVCIDGNYETRKPNGAQMLTLVKLIRDIEKRYKINARVRGHKETSQDPTACPGKNIGTSKRGWLKQVITNVNDKDYPLVPPVESPEALEIARLKKEMVALKEELKLQGEINIENGEELEGLQRQYDTLYTEKTRIETEKAKCQIDLSKLQDQNCFRQLIDKFLYWIRRLRR